MAIIKKILKSNGIETNYHVLSIIESDDYNTKVCYKSFYSKSTYNKFKTVLSTIRLQNNILNKFSEFEFKELSEEEQRAANIMQNEVNRLSDKLSKYKDFDYYVLDEIFIVLPRQDNLSIDNLEELSNNILGGKIV